MQYFLFQIVFFSHTLLSSDPTLEINMGNRVSHHNGQTLHTLCMLYEDTGGLTLSILVIKNFIKIRNQGASASNLTCTYRYYRIPLLLRFLIILFAWCQVDVSVSVKTNLTDSSSLAKHVVFKTVLKRNILGKIFEANTRFYIITYVLLIYTTLCIWTCNLLLLSGDIHPNPGPASTASTWSFSSSQETVLSFSLTDLNLTNLANHL